MPLRKLLDTVISTEQVLKPSTVLILVTRVATIWFSDKPSSTDCFIHVIPYWVIYLVPLDTETTDQVSWIWRWQ